MITPTVQEQFRLTVQLAALLEISPALISASMRQRHESTHNTPVFAVGELETVLVEFEAAVELKTDKSPFMTLCEDWVLEAVIREVDHLAKTMDFGWLGW